MPKRVRWINQAAGAGVDVSAALAGFRAAHGHRVACQGESLVSGPHAYKRAEGSVG